MAREYIDETLELFEKIGDRGSYALTLGNLADWHYLAGNHEAASEACESTIRLANELNNEELICETNIRKARLMWVTDSVAALVLMKRAYEESVKKKWNDLELKSEFYLLEWEILKGRNYDRGLALTRLLRLKKKEPPAEFICRIYKLMGLVQYAGGDQKAARISFMAAYRVARRSDLVYDAREVISLYSSLWPEHKESVGKRMRSLESRILENLDKRLVGQIKISLKRRLRLYLLPVDSLLRKPSTVLEIS
jgi:hypothetical protein